MFSFFNFFAINREISISFLVSITFTALAPLLILLKNEPFLGILEIAPRILPLIKNCNISICNDSSFSHLSSALGIKTITLMADTPLIYGNYSSRMFPIIPEGESTVTHNTLGKDKINPQKIFERFLEIIA